MALRLPISIGGSGSYGGVGWTGTYSGGGFSGTGTYRGVTVGVNTGTTGSASGSNSPFSIGQVFRDAKAKLNELRAAQSAPTTMLLLGAAALVVLLVLMRRKG